MKTSKNIMVPLIIISLIAIAVIMYTCIVMHETLYIIAPLTGVAIILIVCCYILSKGQDDIPCVGVMHIDNSLTDGIFIQMDFYKEVDTFIDNDYVSVRIDTKTILTD